MKEPKNWSCQHFAWAIFSQMRMLNFDINLPLTTAAKGNLISECILTFVPVPVKGVNHSSEQKFE